jgi:hypothetical protein
MTDVTSSAALFLQRDTLWLFRCLDKINFLFYLTVNCLDLFLFDLLSYL